MKKGLLLVSILFISVISTACINNLAVQELNNKAKEYMDKGDYQEAIARLKSSLDLDSAMFETHYNLAVAYTKAEDYANAIKVYEDAIALKPDFAETYYSLAVCQENLAKDIMSEEDEDEETAPQSDYINYLNAAIANYKTYLEKSPQATDKKDVEEKIEQLNELISDAEVPVAR